MNRLGEGRIPYSKEALKQDLRRAQVAWSECQANRERRAIHDYLSVVFNLVSWWAAEDQAVSRARWALLLQNYESPKIDEPFAAIIFCTSDPVKVDKRTRSKWSCVLRYAAEYKSDSEPLDQFIKRQGGINACAARYARHLGRRRNLGERANIGC